MLHLFWLVEVRAPGFDRGIGKFWRSYFCTGRGYRDVSASVLPCAWLLSWQFWYLNETTPLTVNSQCSSEAFLRHPLSTLPPLIFIYWPSLLLWPRESQLFFKPSVWKSSTMIKTKLAAVQSFEVLDEIESWLIAMLIFSEKSLKNEIKSDCYFKKMYLLCEFPLNFCCTLSQKPKLSSEVFRSNQLCLMCGGSGLYGRHRDLVGH